MLPVLLINEKGFHVGCVNKNNKNILVTMKGKKKYSSLVEINSMLQELRDELLEKGHALQKQSIRMRMPFAPLLEKSSFSWKPSCGYQRSMVHIEPSCS